MKVQTTEAQVWWVALYDEIRPLKMPPPGALLEAVQRAFSFRVVPTEFKPGQGIELQQGVLSESEGPIAIEKIILFNDGLNIAVHSTTDDADRVLNKTLETIFALGVREPVTPPSHTYASFVVADFDCSIDNFFPASLLAELAEMAEMAPKNGPAHALNFGFQFDPFRIERRPLARGNPGFRIERKEGFPYEGNRYFSVANLPTSRHLRLLEHFEAAAQKARA